MRLAEKNWRLQLPNGYDQLVTLMLNYKLIGVQERLVIETAP